MVLVSTGAWWEKGNFDTVIRIVEELAEDASVEFAGALIRPHAFLMRRQGELTDDGEAIVDAARRAGHELIEDGHMDDETLDAISRPLIGREELRLRYNQALG